MSRRARERRGHLKQYYAEAPFPKLIPKRVSGKAKTDLRRQVFERDEGICQRCGNPVPFYDEFGCFDVFRCGHAAHKKGQGAGGDDTLENMEWSCYDCHGGFEHAPRWSSKTNNH